MRQRAETSLEDPQAQLERALIEEYLHDHGCSLSTVTGRPSSEQHLLLRQASQYAVERLAEIDARAAYIHGIHDATNRKP